MEVTHEQLGELIDIYYEMKPKRALMVTGTIGIGKSEFIRQKFVAKAKAKNLKFVDWVDCTREKKIEICKNVKEYLVFVDERIALKDSTDNKGVPLMDGNKINVAQGDTTFDVKYLEWVKTLIMNVASLPNSNVIFFKDEINLAPPSVQSAEYQIILDRALDDLAFSTNTFIIAAGNRQEDRSNVFEMSMALKNRFGHCTLSVPSVDSWGKWAIENKIDNRVISYVSFFKGSDALFNLPQSDDDAMAFPTPRTVTFCAESIKNMKGMTTPQEWKKLELAVSSWVGDAWANDFKNWLKLNQKVNINEVLDNPKKINDYGIDLQTSVISAICTKYSEDNTILLKAVNVGMQLREEISAYMLRMLAKVNTNYFMSEVSKSENYKSITDKFSKYFLKEE